MAKQNKPAIRFKGFTDAWEQRKLDDVVEFLDTMRKPLEGAKRISGSYPYYGASGIVDYVDGYLFDEELILLSEDGANITDRNYPVCFLASGKYWVNNHAHVLQTKQGNENNFICNSLERKDYTQYNTGMAMPKLNKETCKKIPISCPEFEEQKKIGDYFRSLDHLITLHQRKPYSHIQRRCNMLNEAQRTDKFCEYYAKWITVYKKGAIRQVTMDKYLMTQKWLEKLIPDLKICDLNRIAYQQLLNDYAEYHERQTTMDFHHQLKGAVLDAVDEGLIDRDPTRKAIIKGKAPSAKKIKYLNQFELHTLLASLELKDEVNWDYFILLVAKTGMRFSEALALTPKDFDFYHQTLSISKTWDYKGAGGFQPTKNKSSVRKIQIDWQSVIRFSELVKGLPDDQPIFVDGKVYNSTVNDVLSRHCERCNIPVISIHGLRHTHASLLLFTGVSIASVARRLGHSSMTTTQKTYLHIIQELENKDIDLVMRSLSELN